MIKKMGTHLRQKNSYSGKVRSSCRSSQHGGEYAELKWGGSIWARVQMCFSVPSRLRSLQLSKHVLSTPHVSNTVLHAGNPKINMAGHA